MRIHALVVIFLLSGCSALWSVERPIEKGEMIELVGVAEGDVNNQMSVSNGTISFDYGERCEMNPGYRNTATVIGIAENEILLEYSTDHSNSDAERRCFTGIRFAVPYEKYYDLRSRYERTLEEKE